LANQTGQFSPFDIFPALPPFLPLPRFMVRLMLVLAPVSPAYEEKKKR